MMQAAVLEELEMLVGKEVPKPVVGDTDILIAVKACSICGSDIRMFHHGNNRLTPPAIMGHESAGQVVEVGSQVTRFKVGDRVSMGGDVPCGRCDELRCVSINNCKINPAMGYQYPGSFAEYVLVPELVWSTGPVAIVPDHVSYEEAALAEPLACIINGLEMCKIEFGDTLAIIGTGPLGCMLMEVGRLMGCTKVIAINRSRPRLEMAKEFGADVLICSGEEDMEEAVMKATNGLGADVILTACSAPEAQLQTLKIARNRARINLFGGLPKGHSELTIDTNILHYKELYLFGSHGASPKHHQMAVDLIASGTIDMKRYISHRFPLSQAPEAFQAAEDRDGRRVVIKPSDND